MKPEIKQKWVDALNSGEYQQTTGVLRDSEGFCCLGVLSDLYSKETGEPWESTCSGNYYMSDQHEILPGSIVEWAGLPDCDPDVTYKDRKKVALSLLNDDHCLSFPEIADLIEAQL